MVNIRRQRILTAAMLALLVLSAACGNTNDNVRDPNNNQLEQQNFRGDQMNNQNGFGMNNGNQMNNQNGYGMNDRNRMNNADNGMGQRDEVEVAEEAAKKVTQLDFVRSAYVLKTANNAFVAALLENEGELSRHMEDQVAQAVRSVDDSIANVYVSTNPSFIDRVDAYIDDIRQGRPVEGFVEQFGEMIDRIFPNAR